MRETACSIGHGLQPPGIVEERGYGIDQGWAREDRFFEHDGGPGTFEGFGVALLVIVGGAGKRDEDGSFPCRHDFGDGAGAGAAEEQVGVGKEPWHVVDELVDFDRARNLSSVRGSGRWLVRPAACALGFTPMPLRGWGSSRLDRPGSGGRSVKCSRQAAVRSQRVIIVTPAGLVDDMYAGGAGKQSRHRFDYNFIDRVRALAAAEDQ